MVAEESNSKWADSYSDESTSSSSSSDREEEKVHCLMADDNDEVFDFSNIEFTCEDLVSALNEMVHEYKKLSIFEDVKDENKCLKDKSDEASCSQLDESDSLKTELTHEDQKPFNDKTGLRFSSGKSSSGDTCTQSDLGMLNLRTPSPARSETPSSDCTRSPDEISTIGFSTSNWPEQISGDDRRRAAAAVLGEEGRGGYVLGLGLQLM
ncbi:hypothetical protein F511_38348 [Dorcoceras hygrometricum]|uniref:Uncharacterized protein n=1 Tax=Dorcoceras hygrometricum TaxID=472368 RepID=A0A2Z7A413_9LAMI|nr:hypothetical protein F511_38348 [Dorcoceras hygrometricum]